MRRRRGSVFEELLGAFVELPFWASIVGAVSFFVLLHFMPPLLGGGTLTGKIFASVGPMVAPWVGASIIAAGLVGLAKRRWQQILLFRAGGPKGFANFYWRDFEEVVGEAYRREGYTVTQRGGSQPDGGVDLELRRGSEKVIVQCKHWINLQVPVQRVRELLGVLTAEGADRGILVATGGFTSEARAFAAGQPIELIDGRAFAKMVQAIRATTDPPSRTQPAIPKRAPSCPNCGLTMVRRLAKRGKNAGSEFWGCPSYPTCRGILAA